MMTSGMATANALGCDGEVPVIGLGPEVKETAFEAETRAAASVLASTPDRRASLDQMSCPRRHRHRHRRTVGAVRSEIRGALQMEM